MLDAIQCSEQGFTCNICFDDIQEGEPLVTFNACDCLMHIACFQHLATSAAPAGAAADRGQAFASLRLGPDDCFVPPCPAHQNSFVPSATYKITGETWGRIKELALHRSQAENGVTCPYSDCSGGGWGPTPGLTRIH